MLSALWYRLRNTDLFLLIALLLLTSLSLLLLYGISVNPTRPETDLFYKQLATVALGYVVFFALSNTNYRLWAVYSKVVYLCLGFVLLFVLAFGLTIRGTTGWISLGFATIQPVEFAKIGLVIMLAKYFSDHGYQFFLWRHILASGGITAAYVILVLRQPDFGSAIVLLAVWALMLIVVGVPRKRLIVLFGTFVALAVVAWFFVFQQYQKDRILTFLNPQSDMLGVGYNVRQSIIAVGSGQLFGRGFGLGSQSQLKFLPAAETDFIFAVLGEELGLIGVLALLAGLTLLILRLLTVARRTTDSFAAFFALGLAALLAVQSFINIGMNMGIAPVTGIPLPLISAGGSSLLSFFIGLGIVSSIVVDNRSLVRSEKNAPPSTLYARQ